MEAACTDKQISIGACVRVGFLCVQLVRPRLAALSCGCTLLLRVESIGACFRDDRGERYEEKGPLLPPELPHVLTAPEARGLQPSIFIFSSVVFSLSARLACLAAHVDELCLSWLDVSLAAMRASVVFSFLFFGSCRGKMGSD